MNKYCKRGLYLTLFLHGALSLFELIYNHMASNSLFLDDLDITESKKKFTWFIIGKIVKFITFALVVAILDLKENDYDTKVQDTIAADNDELEKPNISNKKNPKFLVFITKHKVLVSTYLFYCVQFYDQINPIFLIFAPYAFYKILHKLYSWREYSKILLWPLILLSLTTIYSIIAYWGLYIKIDPKVLPKEIMNFLSTNNYEISCMQVKVDDIHNILTFGTQGYATFMFFGRVLQFFTTEELKSILYHEIGHVHENGLVYRGYFIKSLALVFFIGELLMVRASKFKPNRTKYLIAMFLLASIFYETTAECIIKAYIFYDEISCDKFSVSKYDRKHLISGLTKLHLRNNMVFNSTWLFNILYLGHPSLERRINLINSI